MIIMKDTVKFVYFLQNELFVQVNTASTKKRTVCAKKDFEDHLSMSPERMENGDYPDYLLRRQDICLPQKLWYSTNLRKYA